ncbi:unnamed protein product [Mytilus coruscus]|uniref:C1q domain-containing protein n=1 Tax=Mytilus coruscus TaxID=42192 RepID=A0A6J8EEF7_MYTCO|nr:unnamed protein product [Mytilus coruscus]
MLMLILFTLYFVSNSGFLLEKNSVPSGQSASTNNQYLTVTEYLGDKTRINHELEEIRRDHDRTLGILTTQLQERLVAIEKSVTESKLQNQTIIDLGSRNRELEDNFTRLEEKLHKLQDRYIIQQTELVKSKDKTDMLEHELSSLKKLQSIQQLQSLHALEQSFQTISSKVNILSSHELVRNQDFIALHNLTGIELAKLGKQTGNLTSRIEDIIKDANNTTNQMGYIETRLKLNIEKLNATAQNQIKQLERTFKNYEKQQNKTLDSVMQQIHSNSLDVVIAACHTSGPDTLSLGAVIKFDNVKTVHGYSDVSSFTSTGKFKCEISGFYYISAFIASNTEEAGFGIMKNSHTLANGWHNKRTNGWNRSASLFIAVDLQKDDNIWIRTIRHMLVTRNDLYSCITIFKM